MKAMKLDMEFVRRQFPQLQDEPEFVFCGNAGGSYVAQAVIDSLDHYNRHLRVQPYSPYPSSRSAGQAMDRARTGWSQALNIGENELTIGPSTSMNSYVMAQALGADWGPGDEIVVTQQDHEANHGVWRRKAEAQGALVREWPVDPETGLLDPDALFPLLNERARWVFFTHCSNIIGTVNPVAKTVSGIRQRCGARVCVDAVAYAPHHIADMKALDVDIYMFSLYKVFGPHQGLMYLRAELQESMQPQSHYFIQGDSHKRFNPAGPQHAQVAACQGVLDYFAAVHRHHGGSESVSVTAMMQSVHAMTASHEARLAAPLIDYLAHAPRVRLLGKTHCRDGDRAATIAFQPQDKSAGDVATALQARGIGAERGHFYAHRLMTSLGIDPADGVVRISLVHYNTGAEVDRILVALEQALQ
ncbi:MAG: aminotransferase class V-fold PLP-dependent enzyme [Halieaceae bacterium]|nr:aminotransferase class V-fold PLP-dependent enzyme [Halieaceae bacterium]